MDSGPIRHGVRLTSVASASGSGVLVRMEAILVDSNLVIGIVNGTIDPDSIFLPEQSVFISVVTIMELYALAGMSEHEQQRIDRAVFFFETVSVTATIARRAGILARTRPKSKADLLIAATAIELHVPVATRNVRDFRTIPGLQVLKV